MGKKCILTLLLGGLMFLFGLPMSATISYYQIGYPLILGGSLLILIVMLYKVATISRHSEKPKEPRKIGRKWIIAMLVGGLILLFGLLMSAIIGLYLIGYLLVLSGGMFMLISCFYRIAIEPSSRRKSG